MGADAVWDLAAHSLRGRPPGEAARRAAWAASALAWRRLLDIERCGPALDRALARLGLMDEAPPPVRALLRESSAAALRAGLRAHAQLVELPGAMPPGSGTLVLKGGARLLLGEPPGTRPIADLDLLAPGKAAARALAASLATLGYVSRGADLAHHLAPLVRPDALPLELHHRAGPHATRLDHVLRGDARRVDVGDGRALLVPSATAMVMHALVHACELEWEIPWRLRAVLDVASLWSDEVDAPAVLSLVRASHSRVAMEILLSAAAQLDVRIPVLRRDAWRAIRRVGRVRLAAASLVESPAMASRLMRYAGVAATGSATLAARLVGGWPGALRRAAVPASALLVACADGAGPRTVPLDEPRVVFAAPVSAQLQLVRYAGGGIAALPASDYDDYEPSAGRLALVFVSRRGGNADLYRRDTLGVETRLTTSGATDEEPALSPDGTRVAFVSSRSGTPRVWVLAVADTLSLALATGSPAYIPERGPAWSPDGSRLAFSSSRAGTSQVYAIAATGGGAVALTAESGGAFEPAFAANGARVVFVALRGSTPLLRIVSAEGGDARDLAADPLGLASPSCARDYCVAVRDPYGGGRRLVLVTFDGLVRELPGVPAGARDPAVER